ncbi:MAG: hypothetical protein ABSE42_01525 [Bryobacteraceae bacterium]|jgi:hypothetical protein
MFDITLGSKPIQLCLQLTSTGPVGSGEFIMYAGDRNSNCSGVSLSHPVGALTLDDTGKITQSRFDDKFGGHGWSSMSGSFDESAGTGSGAITSNDSPILTDGQWSAGGVTGDSIHRHHGAGHGHA